MQASNTYISLRHYITDRRKNFFTWTRPTIKGNNWTYGKLSNLWCCKFCRFREWEKIKLSVLEKRNLSQICFPLPHPIYLSPNLFFSFTDLPIGQRLSHGKGCNITPLRLILMEITIVALKPQFLFIIHSIINCLWSKHFFTSDDVQIRFKIQ